MFNKLMRMRILEGNAALELHDSEVERIEEGGGYVTFVLGGYVHRSHGTPGVSPGSGWSQTILLRFKRATISGRFSSIPEDLAGGRLITKDEILENIIPVPAVFLCSVRMELESLKGEGVAVVADALEIMLVGEPTYVEKFPG